MRIAYWDSTDPEMYFDNPNLIWGSPSVLLEPGDPGYTPPSPSVNQTTTKHKRMKRNNYYPIRLGDQFTWLLNFMNKLPGLAATLGLTPAQVTAAVADCGWLIYVLQAWLPGVRTWALGCSDTGTAAQTGTGAGAQVLPTFTPPTPPAGVVPVAPGALNRIFTLVQLIKDSGKCDDDNARILGIVGSAATGPDMTAIQPVISVEILGGQVFFKWGWGGNAAYLDMCELQVDRNDGKGYVLLAYDTTPNYTDTAPFPAVLTKWSYRARYHVGDAPVGLWSQTASVTVQA